MTPDEFRKAGHRLIDWIADYRANVADYNVMARTAPGEIRAQLPAAPPESPESFEAILGDLEKIILPGLSHWQSPNFFGYFPSNGLLSSVLGDYASTGLGVLGLSWQSSPALTELEEVTTDWMRQMVGLSDAWSGVIQDTASTCTLLALICAREKGGNVVYVSAHSHSSVNKAAMLAGFKRENIRIVKHDRDFAMCPDDLEANIVRDRAMGLEPCAVVATTGTTTSTALDPIESIAQVAKKFGIWLHVDAAMAGSAMILPECRWMWKGIEGADSLVLNPHKWLGIAFDCSLYYVRDPEHLIRVMSTNPSYLQSSADTQVKNLRDWGIPLGRRFRALKIWFAVREQGVTALQTRLRRDLENAQWLAERVRATENWSVLAPVPLQTLCILHQPEGLDGEELDRHTQGWADRVNQSGGAYLTPAILGGRWIVRVSIGSIPTERRHVEALWDLIQREVRGAGNLAGSRLSRRLS
jgi:aromatic-L-amino-acid/L-tryptophan decarboxylase